MEDHSKIHGGRGRRGGPSRGELGPGLHRGEIGPPLGDEDLDLVSGDDDDPEDDPKSHQAAVERGNLGQRVCARDNSGVVHRGLEHAGGLGERPPDILLQGDGNEDTQEDQATKDSEVDVPVDIGTWADHNISLPVSDLDCEGGSGHGSGGGQEASSDTGTGARITVVSTQTGRVKPFVTRSAGGSGGGGGGV